MLTISLGIAQYRPSEAVVDFIQRSDDGLYQAKRTGRNKVVTETELTNSALDDKSGTRAIHIACKNGDKDMIRELMKRNCFLNQKDSKGTTALMLAAAAGHDKIVKLIVDSGADVRMKDRNDDTALEYAEKNNRTKVKELLNLYACEYTW